MIICLMMEVLEFVKCLLLYVYRIFCINLCHIFSYLLVFVV